MLAVIQIIQNLLDVGVESITIPVDNIAEMHCVYPKKNDVDEGFTPEESHSELEILLINGERIDIPANSNIINVFKLFNSCSLVVETKDLYEFEKAYIGVITGVVEDSE